MVVGNLEARFETYALADIDIKSRLPIPIGSLLRSVFSSIRASNTSIVQSQTYQSQQCDDSQKGH